MPKKPMDYSKALIYKICCKDTNITECYIGSTTDFTKRKYQHKASCCNENIKAYNQYVYKFIRENGEWNNWEMVLVEKFPCNDKVELLAKEREWKEILNAKLNCVNPIRYKEDKKKYDKMYYETNKDKVQEYANKYREENREVLLEKKRLYNQKTKEHRKEYKLKTKERDADYQKNYQFFYRLYKKHGLV